MTAGRNRRLCHATFRLADPAGGHSIGSHGSAKNTLWRYRHPAVSRRRAGHGLSQRLLGVGLSRPHLGASDRRSSGAARDRRLGWVRLSASRSSSSSAVSSLPSAREFDAAAVLRGKGQKTGAGGLDLCPEHRGAVAADRFELADRCGDPTRAHRPVRALWSLGGQRILDARHRNRLLRHRLDPAAAWPFPSDGSAGPPSPRRGGCSSCWCIMAHSSQSACSSG